MLKRFFAFVISALLILPLTLSSAGAVAFAQNPFEEYDIKRTKAIAASKGESGGIANALTQLVTRSQQTDSGEQKYIVKFTDEASLSDVFDAVCDYSFTLLADSKEKLFLIALDKKTSFMSQYKNIISYIEEDSTDRKIAAATDDPYLPQVWAYNEMDVYEAWDYTAGSKDVVVAVLDTGINRTHADFSGTTILSGYNTLTQKTNVTTDVSGHGTAICGLIAATANNKVGSAGISYGVTLLPVKITDDSNYIPSSNVIKGLYFAADAGADVINMSFSGLSKKTAEEEAIKYAINKGCIIVAAAGNDGETEYGTMPEYPASYEGVLSVASTTENGIVSSFSQSNEFIDISAPGENITIMKVENGESKYYSDSGTSYSAAFVSGIAALAVSYLDSDVAFDADEFESLVKFTGKKWNRFYGYGVISAADVLKQVNNPIVTGVFNGETYTEKVNITYNRGSVILDGTSVDEKELEVFENGSHTLIITYGEYTRTIRFYVDNKPLTYQHNADFTEFTFSRGNATLDGFPYASGQKITTSGDHVFVLSGPYSNSVTEKFTIDFDLPVVIGVSDGATYETAVCIRIIGSGNSSIDGNSFSGETVVGSNGSHTLVVTNSTLTKSKTYTFRVQNNAVTTFDSDINNINDPIKSIVDEKNGFIILYTLNTQGINVYNSNSLSSSLYFTRLDKVTGYAMNDTHLFLFHSNKITKISRDKVLSGFGTKEEININETMTSCVLSGDNIYFTVGSVFKKYNLSTGEISNILQLSINIDTAFASVDGNYIYMFNTVDDENSIVVFNKVSETVINELSDLLPANTYEKKIIYGSSMFAIGNVVISEESLWRISENNEDTPIAFYGNLLFTSRSIINARTNERLAVFEDEVSNVFIGSNHKVFIFYADGWIDVITNSSNPVSNFSPSKFKAAACDDIISTGKTNQTEYISFSKIYKERSISSFAVFGNWLYVVCQDTPTLYKINAETLVQVDQIPLLYTPKQVIISGSNVYVSFKDTPFIYTAQAATGGYGEYIDIGFIPSDLIVANNKLITIKGGIVVIFNLIEETVNTTGINASGISTANNTIYIYNGRTVSLYDLSTLAFKGSFSTGVNIDSFLVSGNFLFVGSRVYDLTTKKLLYNIGDEVLTSRGNTVLTESGVFSLVSGEYIGTYTSGSRYHYLDEKYNYFAISTDKIVRVNSANGTDLSILPEISFLEQGNSETEQDGTYNKFVRIEYPYGIGFVGTSRFDSGSDYTEGGEHSFTVVLSCGITKQVSFYVIPALAGIQILGGDRTMNVNETITLQIQFLPFGAYSVAAKFETRDKDVISIDQNGVVTALNEGTAIVYASTLDGSFTAECKIRVSKTLLKFNADVTYTVDRNSLLVRGIPAGTNSTDILNALTAEGTAEILDKDGNLFEGVVGTGMTLVLKNTLGEEIDKLTFSILGDLSGDGYISVEDLYVYEEIFGGAVITIAVNKAADINNSNSVTDSDMTALRAQILGYENNVAVVAKPPTSNRLQIFALVNTKIYDQEKVVVTIQLENALGAYALSGILNYNNNLLEYKSCRSLSWEAITYKGDGSISFITYDNDKTESTRNAKTLLEVEFRLKAGALGKQVLFDVNHVIAVLQGVSQSITNSQTLRMVQQRINGDFKLNISNVDFVFSPEVYEYTITVRSNVASLDIDYECPVGASCTISDTIIPENDILDIRIIYVNPAGESFTYTINVQREKERIPDANCYLSELVIEGYSLTPVFHKNTVRYTLTVPYEVEQLSLQYKAESILSYTELSNPKLKVGENTVKITCVAENGSIKFYTITVTREAESTEISQNSEETSDNKNKIVKNLSIVSAIVAFLLAGTGVFIFIRKRKK